jgi:probable addiction module antidote protein
MLAMALEMVPFDPGAHLETEDDVLRYLEAAMEGSDARHIASALGDVARSLGMSQVARKSGVGRRALHATLSEGGNPTLATLMAMLAALGLELRNRPRAA